MRKAFLTFLILAVVSPCFAKYSGGTGEPNTPYQIATAEDLNDIGNHTEDFNKCFVMTADINLAQYTGTKFEIIGNTTNRFDGIFDGDGYILKNLFIDTNGAMVDYLGLFGATDSNSNIKKLRLENVLIHTGDESSFVGALVGINTGSITNCSVSGRILVDGDWSRYIGGLVGWNQNGTIALCRSDASVSGFYYAGGLIGINSGAIFRSCATGEVIGADYGGGLAASNAGTIAECWASGNVFGIYNGTGGLVGSGDGIILNCYATGEVSGNWYVGGLAGSDTTIIDCYSTGKVSGEGYVGGLIGNGIPENVSNSFWDVNTSGQTTSAAGIGKTTTQMQTRSTFTGAGWDFVWETANGPNDVWVICEGASYPKLAWQFIAGDSDNDKNVDFADFALIGNKWMQDDSNLYCGGADLTGDGLVDIFDIAVFVENLLTDLN